MNRLSPIFGSGFVLARSRVLDLIRLSPNFGSQIFRLGPALGRRFFRSAIVSGEFRLSPVSSRYIGVLSLDFFCNLLVDLL